MAVSEIRSVPAERLRRLTRPPAWNRPSYVTVLGVVAALALFQLLFVRGLQGADLASTWLYYSVLTLGFYYVFGLSGQFAFCQAAFAGVGAYVSQYYSREAGFVVGLVIALIVGAVLSLAFVFLVRKASHFYFAIATLAISEILLVLMKSWKTISFGIPGGEITNIPFITLFGYTFDSDTKMYWLLLGVLAALFVLTVWLQRSPVVREAIAERDNHTVAGTLGLPTLRIKVVMFVLGTTIAVLGGAILAHWKGFATPGTFGLDLGLFIFLMLILGGMHSPWGPLVGAFFYVYVPQWISFLQEYNQIFYGALLIVVMVLFPEGFMGSLPRALRRLWGKLRKHPAPVGTETAAPTGGEAEAPPPLATGQVTAPPPASDGAVAIEAVDIDVRFGGVRAVADVSLVVHDREIVALIGPNGSGKTTFLNAVTGVQPAGGRLSIRGREVALGDPASVRQAGVVRAYQAPQTFLALTCLEDVLLSTADRSLTGLSSAWLLRPPMTAHEKARWRRANEALERVGLASVATRPAAGLPYGQRRLLEVARAIAGEPNVLLLDEPSAGLNDAETEVLAGHLRALRNDGIAILVVDHKIDFLTSLCDRMAVLQLGEKIADGLPSQVLADHRVMEAYLGVSEDGH